MRAREKERERVACVLSRQRTKMTERNFSLATMIVVINCGTSSLSSQMMQTRMEQSNFTHPNARKLDRHIHPYMLKLNASRYLD